MPESVFVVVLLPGSVDVVLSVVLVLGVVLWLLLVVEEVLGSLVAVELVPLLAEGPALPAPLPLCEVVELFAPVELSVCDEWVPVLWAPVELFTSPVLVLLFVLLCVSLLLVAVEGEAGVVSVAVPGVVVPFCASVALELVDPVRFTEFGSVVGVPGSVDDCCATAVPIVSNAPIVMIASFFISTSWLLRRPLRRMPRKVQRLDRCAVRNARR